MRTIDEKAVLAANDDLLFSDFVQEQKYFILSCSYRALKKYINENDDEWSIALMAFSSAVKSYDIEKGSFFSYAEMIIKQKLIDFYRTTKKFNSEVSVSPSVFESNYDDDETPVEIKIEINEKIAKQTDYTITDEIEAINKEFLKFRFTFYDLANCSPKSQKTKEACKTAVLFILDNPIIRNEIYQTKQLPIKIIQKKTDLPRKLLENHRKYIIAALEILSGEYPMLAQYMSFIRKDGI